MEAAGIDVPAGERERASAGGVLGKFATLVLFAGAVAWLVNGLRNAPVDGAAKQQEYFGPVDPPLGLVLDTAVRLATGDLVARFTRQAGEDGPSEVLVLEYASRAAAEAQLRSSGGDGPGGAERLAEWEREPSFAWTALIKRGDIEWGPWRTKLLIERSFRKGGGWSEEARVDLSTPGRARVLCVRWPEARPADEKVLQALLAAFRVEPPA